MRELEYSWGIDPGGQGAVAIISKDRTHIQVEKLSNKTKETLSRLFSFWSLLGQGSVYFESVNAMPGEGVSSAFSFGRSTGFLDGCAWSSSLPVEYVQPQVWQRAMALGTIKRGPCDICKTGYCDKRKHQHKRKAQLLFPSLGKITLETCDALLIAEYAWRKHHLK